MYLGAIMNNKNFKLININEPCYFDFLYEDIKTNTHAEILNTIFFEAILRIKEVKEILNSSVLADEMLNNYLQKTATKNVKNPLYESIYNFQQIIRKLNSDLEILNCENKNTISTNKLIKIFFNENKTQYQKVLNTLKQINELINKEVLPNIETDISLDTFEEGNISKKSHTYVNPFEVFSKYGLDYNEVQSYLNERESFLKEVLYFKKQLKNENSTLSKYERQIKTFVKNYKKHNYITLYKDTYTIFLIGKRPILKFLNTLIFKIPYLPDDKAAINRFKKSIEIFKTTITEKELITNTKIYLKHIQKENPTIFSMTPERFARVLFIYDWMEYIQDEYLRDLSLKEKIEFLQDNYKDISNYKYKTLINELDEFKKFISFLSEFLPKKIKLN